MAKSIDLQKEYAKFSQLLYGDIAKQVEFVSNALNAISLAVHRRSEIFGEDGESVGQFITITAQAVAEFTQCIGDTLKFAHFYDRSDDKDKKHENALTQAKHMLDLFYETMADLFEIARKNIIPDNFLPCPETQKPLEDLLIIHRNSLLLAQELEAFAQQSQARMSSLLLSFDSLNDQIKKDFADDIGYTNLYESVCKVKVQTAARTLASLQALKLPSIQP